MARLAANSLLRDELKVGPDELKGLVEAWIADAMVSDTEPERLSLLMVADTLMRLAEMKKLLIAHERRLLN